MSPDPSGPDRRRDPFGKHALFGAAPGGELRQAPAEVGRRALFSQAAEAAEPAVEAPGPAVVECETCRQRSPLGLAALAVQLVPSLWWPTRRYSRYMRCPACHRMAWCRVSLSGWPQRWPWSPGRP